MEKREININKLAQKVLARKPESKGIQYIVEDKDFNLIFEGTAKDVTQRVNAVSQRVVLIEYDSSISLRDLTIDKGQLLIAVFDNNYSSFSMLNFSQFSIDNTDLIFKGNNE